MARALCPGRPIWVAGSTHEGEETIVLDAHRRVVEKFPDALLVLVPRHPQRFETVGDLLTKRHERFANRSAGTAIRRRRPSCSATRWASS
jgi:3-deoxy-D-manno-octulosonic-acid transferase